MATYLLCCTPVNGHIIPFLAVAEFFISKRHKVLFLTGKKYAAAVSQTGSEFIALPEAADFDEDTLRSQPKPGIKGLKHDMIQILQFAAHHFPAVVQIINQEKIDAVFADILFFGATLLLLQPAQKRPPVVYLGVVPLGINSPETAPFGLGLHPMNNMFGSMRNRFLGYLTKQIFRSVQKAADNIAVQLTNQHLKGHVMDWPVTADAIVQFTVKDFEYPRSTLPENTFFIGPISRSSSQQYALPDWWDDLTSGKPVIHVTQGTLANQNFEQLIIPVIEGLSSDDVLIVVTTGGRPLDLHGTVPNNVRLASFLPYKELMSLTDVFITNGGYGGVHFALSAGVPIIVAGKTEEKTEIAARVVWSGAGLGLKTHKPTPNQLRTSVFTILNNPQYGLASKRLQKEIASAPGLQALESILERIGGR